MTTAQITSERIDDIPLLLQWLLDMHIDQLIDAVLKSPHGNRQGLKLWSTGRGLRGLHLDRM